MSGFTTMGRFTPSRMSIDRIPVGFIGGMDPAFDMGIKAGAGVSDGALLVDAVFLGLDSRGINQELNLGAKVGNRGRSRWGVWPKELRSLTSPSCPKPGDNMDRTIETIHIVPRATCKCQHCGRKLLTHQRKMHNKGIRWVGGKAVCPGTPKHPNYQKDIVRRRSVGKALWI